MNDKNKKKNAIYVVPIRFPKYILDALKEANMERRPVSTFMRDIIKSYLIKKGLIDA